MTTTETNFRLKGGKLHVLHTVPFAQVLKEVSGLPTWGYHSDFLLTIPKIPYTLFRRIVAWQRAIVKEHRCESTTSLFLVEGRWIAVPFYQHNTAGSMTADVDFTDERNAALLAKYADLSDVHATIHNHVTSGASQSGRDASDEKNLCGPHITIGHLDKMKLDWHARLSTLGPDGKQGFIQNLSFFDLIEVPLPPGPIKKETLDDLMVAWMTFESSMDEIPEEWKDRFEIRTRAVTTHTSAMGSGYGGYTSNGSAASSNNASLEKFIQDHAAELTSWPYGMLAVLNVESKEAFKASLETALPLVQHAAYCTADHIAPNNPNGYHLLYDHLVEKFGTGKKAAGLDPEAAAKTAAPAQ